jgi:penicillin-binding protein 1C
VLIVWVGNFDGTPNPAFTGMSAAAPLFFDIVGALHNEMGDLSARTAIPVKNLHLTRVAVCSASGLLPTHYCQNTSTTWFIPGVSPIKKDTVYREVMIDPHTGLRSCHPNPNNQFAVYEFWPSDILKIFQQAGMPRRIPPAYMPGCENMADNTHISPVITSPLQNTRYVLSTQAIGIILSAITDAEVKDIHWFVDQQYLGAKPRDAFILWHPDHTGHYVIRAVDDYGQADARDVQVVSARLR